MTMNRHERRAHEVAKRRSAIAGGTMIGNVKRGRVGAAEQRQPTPENLRHDARAAAGQIEEARAKFAHAQAAAGRLGNVGDNFLVAFTEALGSWLHFGWDDEVMVQVAVLKRSTSQVIYRGTIVPNELGREVCRRVAEESRQPYLAVPVGERPYDVVVILTPAGTAAPQWATTITDGALLRQITELLARDAYKAPVLEAASPDPALA